MCNKIGVSVKRVFTGVYIAIVLALVPMAGIAAEPEDGRVKEIAKQLGDKARGFGETINNRQAWSELGSKDTFPGFVKSAEKLLTEPIPEQSDDLFLDFSRTGNRTRWEKVASHRRNSVRKLVIAECIENKGRFIGAIEDVVGVLCGERTWVAPAHDKQLTNFNQTSVDIDLSSAQLAWSMAMADYLLADKLSEKTRKLLRENLRNRIFTPYEEMVKGIRPKNGWMTTTNNWNAVCLASVTGAALAVLESPQERALYIAAAEHYSENFLKGFTPDGYCSEGLSYWNYGFGHYVMLCEMIHHATGGKLDLFAKTNQAALFGVNIEIVNGVSPAFADCPIDAAPCPLLMYYVNRRLGLGLKRFENIDKSMLKKPLYQSMMYAFENSASLSAAVKAPSELPGIRSWFADAGVLICRPGPAGQAKIGVALKGGHNNEHHNHNDVGSYVVVLADTILLADPGGEVYTRRTFSEQRYESNVLNSFGHPVPVVAGKLQTTGRSAAARVVMQNSTDDTEKLVLDIASAYDVAELEKLQRSFVYSRVGSGSLVVTDEVKFSQPKTFGTALITFEKWKVLSPGKILIGDGKEALVAEIDAGSAEFKVESEIIKEDVTAGKPPARIGINLTKPVKCARIQVTISPVAGK